MALCILGLGSNESTPAIIHEAANRLRRWFPDIVFSRLVQTSPVDFASPRPFYNCVAACTAQLSPAGLRARLKELEKALGRQKEDKARGIVRIDLDLLEYDGEVLKPGRYRRIPPPVPRPSG